MAVEKQAAPRDFLQPAAAPPRLLSGSPLRATRGAGPVPHQHPVSGPWPGLPCVVIRWSLQPGAGGGCTVGLTRLWCGHLDGCGVCPSASGCRGPGRVSCQHSRGTSPSRRARCVTEHQRGLLGHLAESAGVRDAGPGVRLAEAAWCGRGPRAWEPFPGAWAGRPARPARPVPPPPVPVFLPKLPVAGAPCRRPVSCVQRAPRWFCVPRLPDAKEATLPAAGSSWATGPAFFPCRRLAAH